MTPDLLTWPMIFAGGLLGSSHCVGMCGGFAMIVGASAQSRTANLKRQLVYSTGRICTYSLLGGIVAGLGSRFTRAMPSVVMGQAALAVLAGALLLMEGLKASGYWPARFRANDPGCSWRTGFAALLRSGQTLPLFIAGFTTGWLPCGLVYAFLALAAQCGSVVSGAASMFAFGAGTLPLMLSIGLAPGWLSLTARRRLMRVAAWCVIATAILTLARGATLANPFQPTETPNCPFCRN